MSQFTLITSRGFHGFMVFIGNVKLIKSIANKNCSQYVQSIIQSNSHTALEKKLYGDGGKKKTNK